MAGRCLAVAGGRPTECRGCLLDVNQHMGLNMDSIGVDGRIFGIASVSSVSELFKL
jgi:hypothetical protein